MVSFIDMDKLENVKKYCIDVIAHDDMDIEYTTSLGNGVNPNEVGGFARSILVDILNMPEEEIEKLADIRACQLRDYYFGDRKEYW